jgi:uncharacterized protein YndB with AHSA1/START domain
LRRPETWSGSWRVVGVVQVERIAPAMLRDCALTSWEFPCVGRHDMAQASVDIAAPPADVWAVLADGWTYAGWVVGTAKIRAVDDGWPQVGSKLHHAVGAWPLLVRDETQVLSCALLSRLVIQPRAWPAGEATAVFTLRGSAGGTNVLLTEEPTRGPGAWLNNRALEAVGDRRLAETLDRLGSIAQGRAH